jgi:hypothetical protein
MDSGKIVTVVIGLMPNYIIAVLVYAGVLKWVQRSLTYRQSLKIAGVAIAVSIVLLVVFYFVRAKYFPNKDVDNPASLIALCVTGIIATKSARNYGVEKVGWLGVGARVGLWILTGSSIFVVLGVGVVYLLNR